MSSAAASQSAYLLICCPLFSHWTASSISPYQHYPGCAPSRLPQDGVFSASYSGRRSGYSPAQFLHTWWMLAGAH